MDPKAEIGIVASQFGRFFKPGRDDQDSGRPDDSVAQAFDRGDISRMGVAHVVGPRDENDFLVVLAHTIPHFLPRVSFLARISHHDSGRAGL
ncbi:MAG: hypothetical protein ABSG32_32445 [Terriglobia bacterium]|jgi:hypothetical protein